jgi:glycyl-tRNA synthetase beta subunit
VQDVSTGAVTYGHRFLATSGRAGRAIKVRSFDEYRKKLAESFVILSRNERRDRIMRDLEAQARRIGGRAMLHQHAQAPGAAREVPDPR